MVYASVNGSMVSSQEPTNINMASTNNHVQSADNIGNPLGSTLVSGPTSRPDMNETELPAVQENSVYNEQTDSQNAGNNPLI